MVVAHSVGADSLSARGTIWDIPPYGMVNESFFAYFLFKESRSKQYHRACQVLQERDNAPARDLGGAAVDVGCYLQAVGLHRDAVVIPGKALNARDFRTHCIGADACQRGSDGDIDLGWQYPNSFGVWQLAAHRRQLAYFPRPRAVALISTNRFQIVSLL